MTSTKSSVAPKVTIAIPTFNRAGFLRQAIDSALGQTYENIEVVISDNASSDNTQELISTYDDDRLVINRQNKNVGMVQNWNTCLQKARGEYFILLSDDDYLEHNAVELLVSNFTDPAVALAYGRYLNIDQNSKPIRCSLTGPLEEFGESFIVNSLKFRRNLVPSATMHRVHTAKLIGGFPDIGTMSDMALRLAIANYGTVRFIPQLILKYRVHNNSFSNNTRIVVESFGKIIAWADHPDSPLFAYRYILRRFCILFAFKLMILETARGNLEERAKIESFLSCNVNDKINRAIMWVLKLYVTERLFRIVLSKQRKTTLLATRWINYLWKSVIKLFG